MKAGTIPIRLAVTSDIDVGVLADVLTELHLRRESFCSESHRREAEEIVDLYYNRQGRALYQDRGAGK